MQGPRGGRRRRRPLEIYVGDAAGAHVRKGDLPATASSPAEVITLTAPGAAQGVGAQHAGPVADPGPAAMALEVYPARVDAEGTVLVAC